MIDPPEPVDSDFEGSATKVGVDGEDEEWGVLVGGVISLPSPFQVWGPESRPVLRLEGTPSDTGFGRRSKYKYQFPRNVVLDPRGRLLTKTPRKHRRRDLWKTEDWI